MISTNGSCFINGLRYIGSILNKPIKFIGSFLSKLSCITNPSDTVMSYQNNNFSTIPRGQYANIEKICNRKDEVLQSQNKLATSLNSILEECPLHSDMTDKLTLKNTKTSQTPSSELISNLEHAIEEDKKSSEGTAWYARYNPKSINQRDQIVGTGNKSPDDAVLHEKRITNLEQAIKEDRKSTEGAAWHARYNPALINQREQTVVTGKNLSNDTTWHEQLITNLEQAIAEDKKSPEGAAWYARYNPASISNLEKAIAEDKKTPESAAWYERYNPASISNLEKVIAEDKKTPEGAAWYTRHAIK